MGRYKESWAPCIADECPVPARAIEAQEKSLQVWKVAEDYTYIVFDITAEKSRKKYVHDHRIAPVVKPAWSLMQIG